ncbi:MAG TPA: patatin-like phospholipase family protein [Thermoanaerobaculia bacterium]|jgi:hypothetical protein|nr:patatin-like phospholipase family protein [Thermoanaerobaculia bacterium]
MSDGPLPLSDVLREEYERQHGELPPPSGSEPERLKDLFGKIHALPEPRTAFCISGGGIRSATFALGVMQRLARVGVLPMFDYLSTVSGGGYIGGWLSSYARRNAEGIAGVARELNAPASSRDPLRPEAAPLMWLRQFSNYLTPRLGLLSGDTWADVASYLRNLLLNWLVFVPLLIAALAVPRLSIAVLRKENSNPKAIVAVAIVAFVAFLVALIVLAVTRPVSNRHEGWLTNGRFLRLVFAPLFLASICVVLYWGTTYKKDVQPIPWSWVYAVFIGSSVLSAVCYMVRFAIAGVHERRSNVRHDSSAGAYTTKKFVLEVVAAAVAGAVAAGLCQLAATYLFPDPLKEVALPTLAAWKTIPPQLTTAPGELFLCLGVPVVLLILFLQSAIFVGGASWFNEDYDREWWGRAAGWVLVAGFVWIAFTALAIYGPILIYSAPRAFTAIGGASGLFSILMGRSGKTAASEQGQDEQATTTASATNIGLGLAGPIFAVAILAALSLATSMIWLAIHKPPTMIPKDKLAYHSDLPPEVKKSHAQYQIAEDSVLLTSAEIDGPKERAIEHLYAVDHTGLKDGLALVFGLTLFGWFVSLFIGVNQFSLHGLYRNRLVRAYLGASRWSRHPNAFSGFDPNDNLPMHLLRPEMFWANSFNNVVEFADKLEVSDLKDRITDKTRDAVEIARAHPDEDEKRLDAGELLANDLNHVLDHDDLDRNSGSSLPRSLRNRRALELAFGPYITPLTLHQRPMHVVNMALNLVRGDNLAWQERKAESFAVSPLYAGTPVYSEKAGKSLGYRPTRLYGGPAGVSLGTAVAISGAAASPNMGYNSSPALSFLLTLFNVRLGWWFGNPGEAGNHTYDQTNPTTSLYPLLAEAFGATNDTFPYIYLSDGGHFENLAVYEMVLRRCKYIIVTDASADAEFGFDSLGNAIRKIRIDLGIPIEINRPMGLYPRNQKDPKKPIYCAVADIHYGAVDAGAADGKLLYIKPAFYGKEEPKDIYNYAVENAAFPHQTTGDQWFSESQFESYRTLGEFEMTQINNGRDTFGGIAELIKQAEAYVDRNGP